MNLQIIPVPPKLDIIPPDGLISNFMMDGTLKIKLRDIDFAEGFLQN